MSGDRIEIRRLSFFGRHGVLDAEAALGQRFVVSITAYLDLQPVARRDDCEAAVCYNQLAMAVLEIGERRRFRTLEALAQAVIDALFTVFPPIEALEVCVEKPGAPVAAVFDTVAVTLSRKRNRAL